MVIYPESFNIKPDSEVTVNFSNLLNTASENAKPKSLLLQKGNYVFLSKYAIRALKDYEKQRKEGKEPVFHVNDIDLPHDVDYWQ